MRWKISTFPDILGNFFLGTAIVTSLFQVITSIKGHLTYAKNFSYATSLFLIGGAIYLLANFLSDDFSFLYVAQNSNLLLPTFYKVSAFWSAHEGSFYLMILLLSVAGSIGVYKSKDSSYENYAIATLGIIIFIYLLFLVFVSSPFIRLESAPINGVDLNPLLQDPLLAIHPPIIFSGYILYAITFSYVVAGLFDGFSESLFKTLKFWAGISWFTLSLGILLGSVWAYYELGWGGYWFWDPVENVSLMPWIAGTALTHSLVYSRDKLLLSWMVFLSILTFLLSVFGSFIVRSGILNSVHSFAADPSRGIFLLSIFALFSLASFILFVRNFPKMESPWPKLGSRNYLVVLNNLILSSILLIVFIGTLYPILTEVIYEQKLSIGPSYFSNLITPLVIVLIALFTYEQFMQFSFKNIVLIVLGIIFAIAILFFFLPTNIYLYLIVSLVFLMLLLTKTCYEVLVKRRLVQAHKIFGHLSVVLLTLAVIFNHNFSERVDIRIAPGEQTKVLNTNILFSDLEVVANQNFDAVRANFLIKDDISLLPEKRIYKIGGQITSETSVSTSLLKDYLIVLGDRYEDGSWSAAFSIKYGILLIWISASILLASILYGTIRRS